MKMTRASRWVAAGTLVLVAAAGVAVAAPGDGVEGGGKRHARERFGRFLRERGERRGERREHRMRAMQRLLDAPDAQAKAALDASRELERIRDEARAKAAAVIVAAHREAKDATPEQRQAIRSATREKLRALRDEVRAPAVEQGMKVVKALTPEQRKAIEDKAREHGRTVDDAMLARRFARRLASPRARALLEARLAEAPR